MPGFADDLGKLTPHLRRLARALVRGHGAQAADDLVQETVVLASRADLPKRGPTLASWCFAALIRLNRIRQRPEDIACPPQSAGGPLPFLPKEVLRLDALSLDLREVLLLTVLSGLAYQQVADILNVDVDLVFARLTQARDLLAKSGGADFGVRHGDISDRGRHGSETPHLRLVK
jgi:RNA polymerase sigma-70 factor (ECF subfamily)